jgi:hypothetical protein
VKRVSAISAQTVNVRYNVCRFSRCKLQVGHCRMRRAEPHGQSHSSHARHLRNHLKRRIIRIGRTSMLECVPWHEPHAVRANAAPAAASPVSCAYAATPDARVKMRAKPDATEFIRALLIGFFEGIVPAYLVCANSAGAIYAGTAARSGVSGAFSVGAPRMLPRRGTRETDRARSAPPPPAVPAAREARKSCMPARR